MQYDINVLFNYANPNDTVYDTVYSNIARICKEWFDTSSDKEEYESLQKKLNYVDKRKNSN